MIRTVLCARAPQLFGRGYFLRPEQSIAQPSEVFEHELIILYRNRTNDKQVCYLGSWRLIMLPSIPLYASCLTYVTYCILLLQYASSLWDY